MFDAPACSAVELAIPALHGGEHPVIRELIDYEFCGSAQQQGAMMAPGGWWITVEKLKERRPW
jgi:hypothetical protein